jgi:guanine deaminase
VAQFIDTTATVAAHRGALLHFLSDPGLADDRHSYDFIEDGVLLVKDGLIAGMGPATSMLSSLSADVPVIEHPNSILMPGFIDTHIHYPQTDVIGAGGRNLLDWLERYTFPAEARFGDREHARGTAEFSWTSSSAMARPQHWSSVRFIEPPLRRFSRWQPIAICA